MTNSYRVVWEIDIDAASHYEAAELALAIHRDRESIASVFSVAEDGPGNLAFEVDLDPGGDPVELPCRVCGEPAMDANGLEHAEQSWGHEYAAPLVGDCRLCGGPGFIHRWIDPDMRGVEDLRWVAACPDCKRWNGDGEALEAHDAARVHPYGTCPICRCCRHWAGMDCGGQDCQQCVTCGGGDE